jgi:hypothetical protein
MQILKQDFEKYFGVGLRISPLVRDKASVFFFCIFI